MYEDISPKFILLLIEKIYEKLYEIFSIPKNEKIAWYMKKRQNLWYKFWIQWDDREIDLLTTLTNINNNELIIKIAMDLWIETPWFIPAVPEIKNELKEENKNIHDTFMKAFKSVSDSPDDAIGFANSALESIIKTILQDNRIEIEKDKKDTLYKLSEKIIRVFWMNPELDIPKEVKQIWSWLVKTCQWIEQLRSEKTDFHWKTKNDIVIKDGIYAYFVVNAVSTIGLFLLEVYKENYPEQKTFNPDDLPF